MNQGTMTSDDTMELEEGEEVVTRNAPEEDLKDTITIFGGIPRSETEDAASLPRTGKPPPENHNHIHGRSVH